MPGLAVPDDWDGETYKCYKIYWPKSEQYEAVLLGQLSEPQRASYWTPGSGNPEEVEAALLDGENLTLPTLYSEDCQEGVLTVPLTFSVYLLGNQVLPINNDWTAIDFGQFSYHLGATGYDVADARHKPTEAGVPAGIWHYDLHVRLDGAGKVELRIRTADDANLLRTIERDQHVTFSFEHLWTGEVLGLWVECRSSVGLNVLDGPSRTWWSGRYIGPGE